MWQIPCQKGQYFVQDRSDKMVHSSNKGAMNLFASSYAQQLTFQMKTILECYDYHYTDNININAVCLSNVLVLALTLASVDLGFDLG